MLPAMKSVDMVPFCIFTALSYDLLTEDTCGYAMN